MNSDQLRVCCVCLSNMNRSMAAHNALALRGYSVCSYGTGNLVRLPGLSADRPAEFAFGTPYEDMMTQLRQVNAGAYQQNGVLEMLERNAKIKKGPERWSSSAKERFDLIICYEARVFETVVEDFVVSRSPVVFQPAFVINLEILDTHSSAAVGASVTVDLVKRLDANENLQSDLYDVIRDIETKSDTNIFVVPVFY